MVRLGKEDAEQLLKGKTPREIYETVRDRVSKAPNASINDFFETLDWVVKEGYTTEAELEGDPLVGKTARTLEHLTAKHPGRRFALVLGTDVMAETSKWYRFDRIKELARLVVVARYGFHGAPGPALPKISSSEIRDRIRDGADVSRLVPAPVLAYIREKGLYR